MARRKRKIVLGGPRGQFDDVRMTPATYTTFHFPVSGGASPKKQTIDQTIVAEKQTEVGQNQSGNKKPWTALATDLKDRWFAEMRKRNCWIPRNQFLTDFLSGTEGSRDKWKGLTVTTEDRRFQDNPKQWKAESNTLKTSFRSNRKNRR